MTNTHEDAAPLQFYAGPEMVTVTEDGKQVTPEIAGLALVYVGQKNRKLLGEALAFALLGDK